MNPDPAPRRAIVIMAGGSGERFWPVSDRATPKQLLRLHDDRTMLEAAFARAARIVPEERVFVAAGERLRETIGRALPRLAPSGFVAEPFARNTAACLGLAACHLEAALGGDTVFGVLTADHIIEENERFFGAVEGAMAHAAAHEDLVTIGISPTHPETGFGYLEVGEVLADHRTNHGREKAHRVRRFAEKPDLATARRFVETGNHLWNSGMFFFRASTLLDAFSANQPAMAEQFGRLRASVGGARPGAPREGFAGFEPSLVEDVFGLLPNLPIDIAIMEKSDRVAAIVGRFGWEDVGSWDALARIRPTDEEGNCRVGPSVALDSRGNILYNAATGREGGRPTEIVLHGVHDMIVVRTDKAILVTPKSRAQSVKEIVRHLALSGRDDLL